MREFECVSNRVQFHSTELYKGLQNISTGVAQTLLVGVWVNDDQEGIKDVYLEEWIIVNF